MKTNGRKATDPRTRWVYWVCYFVGTPKGMAAKGAGMVLNSRIENEQQILTLQTFLSKQEAASNGPAIVGMGPGVVVHDWKLLRTFLDEGVLQGIDAEGEPTTPPETVQ